MMSKQWDNTNSGTLFKNDKQGKASCPDYNGSINVDGRDYWISAWIKEGAKGKFMSLAVKPKDAAAEGHPDRFQKPNGSREEIVNGLRQPRGSNYPNMDDDVPF